MGIMPMQFDDRGVSEVIGAILVFGILIAALGVYQGFMVPDENAGAEFDHSQDVHSDMVDTRVAILDAASTGEDRHATVRLGTQLPNRLIAVNPPDPTGELMTTDEYPIQVFSDGAPITEEVLSSGGTMENRTRFLSYKPEYREHSGAGDLFYENTILYSDFGDTNRLRSSQQLVQGDRVYLYPLVNEYREEGSQAVSVDFYAGFRQTAFDVEDLSVKLPTRLSESEWENILSDQLTVNQTTVDSGTNYNTLTLEFSENMTVIGAPVGIGSAPVQGPRDPIDPPGIGGDGGGLNPTEQIRLTDVEWVGSGANVDTVELELTNMGDAATNLTRARFTLQGAHENIAQEITGIEVGDTDHLVSNLQRGAGYEDLSPQIKFDPNGELNDSMTLSITFDDNIKDNPSQNLITVIEFITDSDERVQYMF